jgi:hypothetical protein
MSRRNWVILIVVLLLPGLMAFLLALGLMAYFMFGESSGPLSTFEAHDPNSPTVIRITGIGENWDCVISADGERQTQFAGWPKDRLAAGAQVTAVEWHSNPDWVEIILASGQRLKLTWDVEAAERARKERASHYFLNPRYEILPGR